jgi:hypothetical protein
MRNTEFAPEQEIGIQLKRLDSLKRHAYKFAISLCCSIDSVTLTFSKNFERLHLEHNFIFFKRAFPDAGNFSSDNNTRRKNAIASTRSMSSVQYQTSVFVRY